MLQAEREYQKLIAQKVALLGIVSVNGKFLLSGTVGFFFARTKMSIVNASLLELIVRSM